MKLTYKFRLRDTCDAELRRQARAVNMVFNFCEETQRHALKWGKRWPSGYDLVNLTAGSYEELNLSSQTIQHVCLQYERSRKHHKKRSLRWRVSNPKSPNYSLGWVPFSTGGVTYRDGAFWFRRRKYKAWVTRDIKDGQKFGAGSFSQDAQGRWYINLSIQVDEVNSNAIGVVGVDLGLKDLATLSTGEKIEHPRWYRSMQERLANAQRARKKRLVRKLHARTKAQRSDFHHKLSNRLVREHGAIFVGNVSAVGLAKTHLAKSVFDAGWSELRYKLAYKAIRHQIVYREVKEAFSTQTCSDCGFVGGPKGREGLAIRQWVCQCGALHDRDVNAAKIIAARGLASLGVGARYQYGSGLPESVDGGAVNTSRRNFPSSVREIGKAMQDDATARKEGP